MYESNINVGDKVIVNNMGVRVYAKHTGVLCHAKVLAEKATVVRAIRGEKNVTLEVQHASQPEKTFCVLASEVSLAVSSEKQEVLDLIESVSYELEMLKQKIAMM